MKQNISFIKDTPNVETTPLRDLDQDRNCQNGPHAGQIDQDG